MLSLIHISLGFFVTKTKLANCDSVAERPTCSLSTSTSSQQDTCVSEACSNNNNVSGLVSEFSENSETIIPGCSDTNVLSQNESSLLCKITDISNLLLQYKSQIDGNLKYAVLCKNYTENMADHKVPVKTEGAIMRSFQYSCYHISITQSKCWPGIAGETTLQAKFIYSFC